MPPRSQCRKATGIVSDLSIHLVRWPPGWIVWSWSFRYAGSKSRRGAAEQVAYFSGLERSELTAIPKASQAVTNISILRRFCRNDDCGGDGF